MTNHHDNPRCRVQCERSTDTLFPFDDPLDDVPATTDDCPIKPGDHIFVASGGTDFEGKAIAAVNYPLDEKIAIRCETGEEIKVNGWQADYIEINGEEYR